MQFIEIHTKGKLLSRVPLGDVDLAGIKSDSWMGDALLRASLTDMLVDGFFKNSLIQKAEFKDPQFFLVFESKMNVKRSDPYKKLVDEINNQ